MTIDSFGFISLYSTRNSNNIINKAHRQNVYDFLLISRQRNVADSTAPATVDRNAGN